MEIKNCQYCFDSIGIGIASKIVTDERIDRIKDIYYYVFCDYPGHGFKNSHLDDHYLTYGDQFGWGDIVTIHLDLKRAEIRLHINDKEQEVAYSNVKKADNVKYRLVVSLCNPDDCVEIVDFHKRVSM